jgi:ATPase subunit of ABC transporter with duplicated ATPase domains
MLILQNIQYIHPDREFLFENLNIAVNRRDKIALIGNNGVGKSILLKLMAGILKPSEGTITADSKPYYMPQILGQFNHLTIAQALQIEEKLIALHEILNGNVTESKLSVLNDDWTIEERCREALTYWQLDDLNLNRSMAILSSGQKTKVMLAGINIHQPEIVLLDEPSNHLDSAGRELLYRFIQSSNCAMIVVSHDRSLLNLLPVVHELNKHGFKVYGGNYDFYREQKTIENEALINNLEEKQKSLRKAKEIEREALERQQRQNARGKNQQKKEGTPKAMMDKMKNDAEKSTARLKGVHADKINAISQELSDLRKEISDRDKMKFGFDNSLLHKGKILISAENLNFAYPVETGHAPSLLWQNPLDFQIVSGERIALKGLNGSGKTTLIQLILGILEPTCGTIERNCKKTIYIDQDYSLINNQLTVYEQAETINLSALPEHEIKTLLNRFLFTKEDWNKPCRLLSGGEKMRLMLCCLTIADHSPDLIILDEPTNNLDIQNIQILTDAMNEYQGTLLVVSHDARFLEELRILNEIKIVSFNKRTYL